MKEPSALALHTAEILKISLRRDYANSDQQADHMLRGILAQVKQKGCKLVPIGNFVFQVTVKGQGLVEIHLFSKELGDREGMAQAFGHLADYLRSIGVKVAYAVTDDTRLEEVGKMTGIPYKRTTVDVSGAKVNAYYVEL